MDAILVFWRDQKEFSLESCRESLAVAKVYGVGVEVFQR